MFWGRGGVSILMAILLLYPPPKYCTDAISIYPFDHQRTKIIFPKIRFDNGRRTPFVDVRGHGYDLLNGPTKKHADAVARSVL